LGQTASTTTADSVTAKLADRLSRIEQRLDLMEQQRQIN